MRSPTQPPTPYTCYIDGSFAEPNQGGVGYIIQRCNTLIQYGLQAQHVDSPFHAEAAALLTALHATLNSNIEYCTFYTDCQQLALSIQHPKSLQHADWRAYREVMQIAHILASNRNFHCAYISREENTQPHLLANLARQSNMSYVGHTYPLFQQHDVPAPNPL